MKRTNILVIEDDHAIRDIISYVLLSEGYDVVNCDKLRPLEELIDCGPQLIVLDEWVNAREGTMLCKEIKLLHHLAYVPVVILSTSAEIEQIAISCKADGFVRKPFDVNALLTEIKRCLVRKSGVPKLLICHLDPLVNLKQYPHNAVLFKLLNIGLTYNCGRSDRSSIKA